MTDADGVTHSIDVQGTSLYEVAAAGLAQLREQGWIHALPATAVLEVEVYAAPTTHKVPMKSLQRWATSPSTSPREELLKMPLRRP